MSFPSAPSFSDLATQTTGVGGPPASPPGALSGGAPNAAGAGVSVPVPAASFGNPPPPPPAPPVTPPPPAPAPAVPPASRALVDYYERSGQLDPGTFSNDLQLTQYLAQMAVTAQQPPAQPAPAPQPVAVQQPAQLATPGQQDTSSPDLIRAAEAMQTAGLLAVENGVWVARNAVASQLAEQMNARAARARMVQAELSDPTDFIRKYGAQAFESALAPFQQQLQQLMQQNQLLQQQIQANQPKPYEAFLETNKAALFTVLPDGKRNLLPAGHAYHNAWTAAADQGITDQAALHAIAQAACTPLLTAPAAPPAAPPPAPWISSVQPATDPSFNKPGTPLAQQGAPPALGLPTGNDGFPDFSQMARQLNSSS